jgi:hypothetical protein
VPNICSLMNIVLDATSSNYTRWRDNMMLALTRYALTDEAFLDDPGWTRIDIVILCWLTNTISPDLQEVIWECGRTVRHLWLRLQNQFLGNRETRTLYLDAAFHNFVQDNLSMSEYYYKFKGMVNALADLGSPIDDRILILNILYGLNQRFKHVGAIIRCYSLFLNFLKVQDDLLLEEIHLDTSDPIAALMAFYSNNTPPDPLPLPLALPHLPGKNNDSAPNNDNDSNNNQNKNNNRHNGSNGDKNINNSGNHGGNNSSNTTATSTGATTNDGWVLHHG